MLAVTLLAGCQPTPGATTDAFAPDAFAPDAFAPDAGADTGAACAPHDAGRSALAWADAGTDAGPSTLVALDVVRTALSLDLSARHAVARIDVAPVDHAATITFEAGALTIESVTDGTNALTYDATDGLLDVMLPSGASHLEVAYGFPAEDPTAFDGWMPSAASGAWTRGLSFLWPRFCGNLYPCHSDPSDGVQVTMEVTGVPAGSMAVFPTSIPFDAPSYMPAVAVDERFVFHDLGTTSAGTHVGLYAFDADTPTALAATQHLREGFDFYETLLGPYHYGDHVASVEADWGANSYGGMEHHPYWHVGRLDVARAEVHLHEAAHGWFGNGVRLRCWEDFVLSEGTVSYLAARAIEATEGATGHDAIWAQYEQELAHAIALHDVPAYPTTCDAIDLVNDPLWSDIPYMKGAFFYRAVEERIGRDVLDAALRAFYLAHVGHAATMQDMIDALEDASCTDLSDLEETWLRGLGNPLAH